MIWKQNRDYMMLYYHHHHHPPPPFATSSLLLLSSLSLPLSLYPPLSITRTWLTLKRDSSKHCSTNESDPDRRTKLPRMMMIIMLLSCRKYCTMSSLMNYIEITFPGPLLFRTSSDGLCWDRQTFYDNNNNKEINQRYTDKWINVCKRRGQRGRGTIQ